MRRFLVVMLVTAPATAAAQTVHHVDLRGACDGLSPCHTTIMAAVTAASPGDTVSIFPGRYTEAVRVEQRAGLDLVGRAPPPDGGLVCEASPRAEAVELMAELFLDRVDDLRIENLVLRGGVVVLRGGGDPSAPANEFVGNRVSGRFFLQTCFDWRIRHNVFDGPLEAAGDARCMIVDNSFKRGGIRFDGQDNSTDSGIVGNVMAAGGIAVESERVRGLRIERNRLHAGDLVIDAREADDNRIDGNRLAAGGLRVSGTMGNRNELVGNHVFDSDGHGIELALAAGGGNRVAGNTSRGHAGCDIIDVEGVDNEWVDNEFDTACGGADG